MEENANFSAVRSLLSQGDTNKALQLTISLLEKDSRFKDTLLRTLRVAEANYNAVRQQELKGILPFQDAQREYSKITDTLLAVLDDIEAGRVPVTALPGEMNRGWRMWAIAGGVIMLLGALAFWFLRGKRDAACPDYTNDNALHVMIVPFDRLGGKELKPALRIRDGIQDLTKKAGIPLEAKVYTRDAMNGANSQEAERLARKCGADLVIFGQYQGYEKDSVGVKMGFKFLQPGGAEGDTPFKTFRDITKVQPARDLEDAVFSLCAMIAVKDKKWVFAKRWMGRIRDKNAEEIAMSDWIEKQGN